MSKEISPKILAIRRMLLVWFGTVLAALLIIALGYLLPNGRVRQHLADAPELMTAEGEHPDEYLYTPNAKLDNFTDSIILGVAIDSNADADPFTKAVRNAYYRGDGEKKQSEYLKEALDDPSVEANSDYTRYWFGSSTVVRFLAIVFGFRDIRFICAAIVVALFVLAAAEIYRKFGLKYTIAFVIALLLTRIFFVSVSLQYVPAYIITLSAVFAICKLSDTKKYYTWLPIIFLLSGTLIAIFDLLTFPLISLGIPLVVALLIELREKQDGKYLCSLKKLAVYSVAWGIGYAATHFIKWVIASIILQRNEIGPAIENFFFRTNMAGSTPISVGDMYQANFDSYFPKIVLIGLVIYAVIWIIIAVRRKIDSRRLLLGTLFIVIAILPYVWFAALSNHSYIHYWMTYRIQAITMFSVLAGSLFCLERPKKAPRKRLPKKQNGRKN